MRRLLFLSLLITILGLQPEGTSMQVVSELDWMRGTLERLERDLVAKYGEGERIRIQRGLRQVSSYWRVEDGGATDFEEFVQANFVADRAKLDAMFERYQRNLEILDGHMLEIDRELRSHIDLDSGEVLPFDEAFAAYDPAAHLQEDFFRNRLAFVALLNFPLTSLEDKNKASDKWTRRQWAEARLTDRFAKRVPAEVNQRIARARTAADSYISDYNIWMHNLVDSSGKRLFRPGLRLLSHWNLRDEIKASYSEKDGLERQRMIQQVMERIVTQTIPKVVINNPSVDWNPYTNEVRPTTVEGSDTTVSVSNTSEPDTRYRLWLENFKAERALDKYSPSAPTLMARRFNEDRELSEERVRGMLEQVVSSPLLPRIAALIQKRLGRPLEPFDIWYNGFLPRGSYTEAQLDEICRKRYPDAVAYSRDMPRLLEGLGFAKDRAEFLASRIVVEPARGSGHAQGAAMREGKAYLRTRVEKDGMNYKGYNIAVHEMGHNVEQVFSMSRIDYTLLQGVPNTAFTEALAFIFQNRDLELLGLESLNEEKRALKVLNDFWVTYEISGAALVDMEAWHWLYKHPEATPAEFRDAVISISKDIWNRYYADVLGRRNQVLLGIYSHMINETLYLPDYPIGHLIAFQIEEHIEKTGKIGPEFERMALLGRLTPDYWMQQATGAPVGAEALLKSTAKALEYVTTRFGGNMKRLEVATLGGGCFWCLEAVFDELRGVESVESGYAGGKIPNPTYEQVCTGTTGHAEVVQIKFDPEEVSFREILQVFFTIHDPTQLNRQGADVGTQYRSVIFYHNAEQRQVAESLIRDMTEAAVWDGQIVTEVVPIDTFYKAEEYHQKYFAKNPTQGYCQFVVSPKVEKFRKYYKERLKQK